LVSLRYQSNDDNLDESNQRIKIKPLPKSLLPPTEVYILRAFIGAGTDIPKMKSSNPLSLSRMQIVVTCGLNEIPSTREANKKGIVLWNQKVESDRLVLPSDPDQIPDIFVYLCKGKNEGTSKRKQIAFKRYKARDLLEQNMAKEPDWISFKEDACVDALEDEVFPGNVMLSLGLGTLVCSKICINILKFTYHLPLCV